MQLVILKEIDAEIVHFFEPSTDASICSKANRLEVRCNGKRSLFDIPLAPTRRPFLASRLSRRASRLDKMNAVFTADRTRVVILYQGQIFVGRLTDESLRKVGRLRQCRNVLHCGVCVSPQGHIFVGEYGHNKARDPVPVWRSADGGDTWQVVYEFPRGSVKHTHGVYHDPFSGRLFIPTGDFAGECFLVEADENFDLVEKHGDGSQIWRPVSLLFEPEHIIWGMDSPLETSHLQIMCRKERTLQRGQAFPGPVWYSKQLDDGVSLLQSSCEPGPGVQSDAAHLFVARDNRAWLDVARFRKDRWPMGLFKYGVLAFADGRQVSDRFALFGEAVVGLDGKAAVAALK